jgi:hypothetical protein
VRPAMLLAVSLAVSLAGSLYTAVKAAADDYLTWSSDRAETVAKSTRVKDSAGQSWWDTRGAPGGVQLMLTNLGEVRDHFNRSNGAAPCHDARRGRHDWLADSGPATDSHSQCIP